ncbi:unnamed protein product [Dovyalis caffra]|uniref:Uncharacterized protein n=1 Tax=Dovyalis caffra TaxID=77055 RepID=A0AAV1RE58_9ROSI|nr:unnamed protein product [Dovyalis caffra]
MKRPLNNRCHMGTHWTIPVVCLHTFYVAALVGFTGAIRHIEFRFNELKDLWQGILVSALSIGVLHRQAYWYWLSSLYQVHSLCSHKSA